MGDPVIVRLDELIQGKKAELEAAQGLVNRLSVELNQLHATRTMHLRDLGLTPDFSDEELEQIAAFKTNDEAMKFIARRSGNILRVVEAKRLFQKAGRAVGENANAVIYVRISKQPKAWRKIRSGEYELIEDSPNVTPMRLARGAG